MSEKAPDLTGHLLAELGRIHSSHDRIFDKLSEQGETLVRNTVTLEEHVRRTNLLEEEMTTVKEEVSGLHTHINKINVVMKLFKPTRTKIKALVAIAGVLGSIYGGTELSKDPESRAKAVEVIEQLLK